MIGNRWGQSGRGEVGVVGRWWRWIDWGWRRNVGRWKLGRWRGWGDIGRRVRWINMRVVWQMSRRSISRGQISIGWSFCFHHRLETLEALTRHVGVGCRHAGDITGRWRWWSVWQRRGLVNRGRVSRRWNREFT